MPSSPTQPPARPSTTLIKNPSLDQTISVMRVKANEAKKTLRPLAARICAGLEPGDYNSEILAIYAWVRRNIRYARDIENVEYVQAPARLLESQTGDCDDLACLLAALTMAMGNEARFLVVGFEDANPSHVLCQVGVQAAQAGGGNTKGPKQWVTLDPVADENTPQMHSRVRMAQVYGVGSGGGGAPGAGAYEGSFGASPGGRAGSSRGGVQTFSVFDPFTRSFTYYEALGNSNVFGARGTKYRPLTQRPSGNKVMGPIGFAPEALALPLPPGARRVGQGTEARGIVAVSGQPQAQLAGVSSTALMRQPPTLIAPTLGSFSLGATEPGADDGETVIVRTSLGEVVFAASVAAVVGVVVQKALKKVWK